MEADTNSSKEDMLSPLSGSNNSDSDPLTQHPEIIHARPAKPNPNPHLLSSSIPTTLNSNSNSDLRGGFSLMVSPSPVVDGTDSGGQKKKRGRPRKYDADGNLRNSYATPPSIVSLTQPKLPQPQPGFGVSNLQTASFQKVMKVGFGDMFGQTAFGEFTPHLVTVRRGEDVAGKILLFGQQGHKGICVLSAIGVVSSVTICQPSCSGGILTYEGRFEILSLTGSYTAASSTGGWVGGLSVSLAGPDGRVVGGGLAGSMNAATPTQLVLGSFTPEGYVRQKRKYVRRQPRPSPTPTTISDPVTAAKPISQAMRAEKAFQSQSSASSERSHDEDNESNQPMPQQNAEASHSMWAFS